MPADLTLLVPEFRQKVETLLVNCKNRGIEMRPSDTVRSPFEQAKIWRQSRTSEEIRKKIAELRNNNAPFLAHCLESVGPQKGDPVTNAIPGLSWHQWGEAVDCFWVVNNKAVWDLTTVVNGMNGFMVYANEAKRLGLDAGLFWSSIKDSPHVQLRKASNPAKIFSLEQIDETMQERFG
jgi:peptidoglycan L-alanyl-D-glutamate endopeptidase CwlK